MAAKIMLIWCRVHWTLTLTSSYSKTHVFDCPHEYDKSMFLKIYSQESVFKNLHICGQKCCLRVDGRCKRRKNLCFWKYLDTCGQSLNDIIMRTDIGHTMQQIAAKLHRDRLLQQISLCDMWKSLSQTVTECCRCDLSHEFKVVWICGTYRSAVIK